ncbi:MAG: hypothetical protein ABJA81_09345 [Nocardioidaceae bacterium]
MSGCDGSFSTRTESPRPSSPPSGTSTGPTKPIGPPTTSSKPPTTDATSFYTSYERDLIALLDEAGVEDADVPEHSYRGAMAWGPYGGRYLLALSTEQRSALTPGDGRGSAQVAGLRADVIDTDAFGVVVQFRFKRLTYQIASLTGTSADTTESGSSDRMHAVHAARAVIQALQRS